MMSAVVQAGTGDRGADPRRPVAGKTGTAETRRPARQHDVVHLLRARPTTRGSRSPSSLENQSGVGGTTAAPIAKQVMQALLWPRGETNPVPTL